MQDDRQPDARAPAPKRNNTRRLVVTIVIIIAVAGVLGWFVTDILQTATSAMQGR